MFYPITQSASHLSALRDAAPEPEKSFLPAPGVQSQRIRSSSGQKGCRRESASQGVHNLPFLQGTASKCGKFLVECCYQVLVADPSKGCKCAETLRRNSTKSLRGNNNFVLHVSHRCSTELLCAEAGGGGSSTVNPKSTERPVCPGGGSCDRAPFPELAQSSVCSGSDLGEPKRKEL